MLLSIPLWFFLGPNVGTGALITLWLVGVLWLIRKWHEDPMWDRRPPSGRKESAPH